MSVYKAVYRVRVGALSREGVLLNPVDFVISTDTDDLNSVRRYYREKYSGFDVEVSCVEQIEVCASIIPVPAEITPPVVTKFILEEVSVTIDEALRADYAAKRKAYENAEDCLRKASIAKILSANTHLEKIYRFELSEVYNETVRANIEAELKGSFVVRGKVCIADC